MSKITTTSKEIKAASAKLKKLNAAMSRAAVKGDYYAFKKLECKRRILQKSLEIIRLAYEIEAEEIMIKGYDRLQGKAAKKVLS